MTDDRLAVALRRRAARMFGACSDRQAADLAQAAREAWDGEIEVSVFAPAARPGFYPELREHYADELRHLFWRKCQEEGVAPVREPTVRTELAPGRGPWQDRRVFVCEQTRRLLPALDSAL